MAHGTAHDPAEHVAAALVRRIDSIGDEERGGAQVVGNDAMARGLRPVRVDAGELRHGEDQVAHHVDVVVRQFALQDRGDALEPHAGVDRRARQVQALAGRDLLELHEHEVPELEEAIAVLLGGAGRAAPELVALVVEDLGAGAAGAGVAHLPEIVGGRDADDLRVREAGDLLPQLRRLVVRVIDGDEQPVLVQAEMLGDQRPGELDRQRLEIVAEREVAEHLEEGVVPRRIADVVEIVVLAAGAHAFLRCRGAAIGPLLDAGEDVLELHHPGIGEHQRRVVARHQRARRHDLVAGCLEEVEKGRADVVDAAHRALGKADRTGTKPHRNGFRAASRSSSCF